MGIWNKILAVKQQIGPRPIYGNSFPLYNQV